MTTAPSRTELLYLSMMEQAALIKSRQISPVDLVNATLARMAEVNPKLNSFLTVTAELALERAKLAESQIMAGDYLGPLHGIPYGVKDNFITKGIVSTGGSFILKDYVPDEDASSVVRLNAAGAVLMGKTHLNEFATGQWHPHHGVARNPWDLERTPGGSSSGSGSGVAAGLSAFALGFDTGGSIRGPGSFNGIYGLRPTPGRVSRHGIYVLSWTLDSNGPLARTIKDLAQVMNVISGPDGLDPAMPPVNVPDFAEGIDGGIEGLRIGVFPEHFYANATDEVIAAVEEGLRVLTSQGAVLKHVTVPHLDLISSIYDTIVPSEATTWHEQWVRDRPGDYAPKVQDRFEVGQFILATQYLKAQRARRIVRDAWVGIMKDLDVFITPTSATPAPLIDEPRPGARPASGRVGSGSTTVFSVNGMPSLAVPAGMSSGGLPLSMLINGRPFEEALMFRVARAFERATDWTTKHPPI
ncbi:MAG: amidase [Chloroflexi bacterium]|nr:amidase [Chloroflexota bacterium]